MLTNLKCQIENQIALIGGETEGNLHASVSIVCSSYERLNAFLEIQFFKYGENSLLGTNSESVELTSYELRALGNAFLSTADYLEARLAEGESHVS